MNKKFFGSLVLASAMALSTAAFATDVDINLGVGSGGVIQAGIANALSDLDSSASVSQIVGLGSVTGNYVDDVNVVVLAGLTAQLAAANAAVPPGSPASAIADATITQVIGLASLDLDNVDNGGNINVGVISAGNIQVATANAIGTAQATADISQLSGVGVVSVNVSP